MIAAASAFGRTSCSVSTTTRKATQGSSTTAAPKLRAPFAASAITRRSCFGAEATCLLIGERFLHLPQAHLTARRENDRIEIASDVFARQVTLQFDGVTGAVFEDNYFDLVPGQKRCLAVVNAAGGSQLTVRALNAEPLALPWKP